MSTSPSIPRGLPCGRSLRSVHSRSTLVACRSDPEKRSVIFYGGSTYTSDDEWNEAFQSGEFKCAPPIASDEVPPPSGEVATIRSLFAFDGAAPELINGRLAMVGFFAALGAEVSSGEGVIMQLMDAPGAVLVTHSLIAAASLVPLFQGNEPDSNHVGPFTAANERLCGRAAMLGLLFLIVSEYFTGGKALL